MVTFVTFLISFSTLGLIVWLDMLLNRASFLDSLTAILNAEAARGRGTIYTAWAGAFVSAVIIDYRRRKERRSNQQGGQH